MNGRERRRAAWLPMSLALVALALVGCPKKQPAIQMIEALDDVTVELAQQHKKMRRELATNYFKEIQRRLESEIETRAQELEVYIYKRTEDKIDDLVLQAAEQLETALEGSIAKLDADLGQAQREAAADRGDKAKELELAAQLSATLAVLGQEQGKLALGTRDKARAKRESALAELSEARERALEISELTVDPNDLAEKALKDYESTSESLTDDTRQGLHQLKRFIESTEGGGKAFLDGLVGKELRGKLNQLNDGLGDMLVERGERLMEEGLSKATGLLDEGLEKAESAISSLH